MEGSDFVKTSTIDKHLLHKLLESMISMKTVERLHLLNSEHDALAAWSWYPAVLFQHHNHNVEHWCHLGPESLNVARPGSGENFKQIPEFSGGYEDVQHDLFALVS